MKKFQTAESCILCHEKQGDYWKRTPHSISYGSLILSNEKNNLQCISCHSLGANKKNGFSTYNDMITMKEMEKKSNYYNEIKKIFKDTTSIRKLSKKISKKIILHGRRSM